MHVISKEPFRKAIERFPNHRASIENTYQTLNKGEFRGPDALKAVFSSLDNFKVKDKWWVLDLAGNHLRLIAFIKFSHNRIYVKHIVSHSD